MNKRRSSFIRVCGGAVSALALWTGIAQAATVHEVFNGDMLGTSLRYFESVAGIPRMSHADTHTFRVQGCTINATVANQHISALRLELGPQCTPDLTTFIGDYGPGAGAPLTPGALGLSSGGSLKFAADCLTLCGNAMDPSVYALWDGPRAAGFLQIRLEVMLVDGAALDAADSWERAMTAAAGEDYVLDTRFNCDTRFDEMATTLFRNVPVTAVTIGHDLNMPGCD